VIELSALLQTPAIHPIDERGPDFRNPAGVGRKTADIATRHPVYTGTPTNGNRLDREVLADFLSRPDDMRAQAAAIRQALADDDTEPHEIADVDELAAEEGGVLLRQHLRRERDARLRARKIAAARKRGVPIACEVCDFDFERTYGNRGRDYIECHHRTPLHVSGKTTTTLDDLALICSNCHRMIHRSKVWMLPEELKRLVDQRASHAVGDPITANSRLRR
jgi:5-methylcytosine-specific restriction protein A